MSWCFCFFDEGCGWRWGRWGCHQSRWCSSKGRSGSGCWRLSRSSSGRLASCVGGSWSRCLTWFLLLFFINSNCFLFCFSICLLFLFCLTQRLFWLSNFCNGTCFRLLLRDSSLGSFQIFWTCTSNDWISRWVSGSWQAYLILLVLFHFSFHCILLFLGLFNLILYAQGSVSASRSSCWCLSQWCQRLGCCWFRGFGCFGFKLCCFLKLSCFLLCIELSLFFGVSLI